jgi:transmembrane sensor
MTDQRFTELLGKELAGEISQEESDELKSIVAADPDLQKEYFSLQHYFKTEEVEDENIDLVYNRIKARIEVPKHGELNSVSSGDGYGIWLKIAAMLVLASGIFLYTQFRGSMSDQQALQLSKVITKPAQIRTVQLADGSKVTMNASSSLRYPKQFKGKLREVYLSGEALFEIHKDPAHPFIVHTDDLNVKVLGTVFVVKAYENDTFSEASLVSGRVALSTTDHPDSEYILKPNDKFCLRDGAVQPRLTTIVPVGDNPSNGFLETSWTTHELIFKNSTFQEVANLFERWYDLKISFKQKELKALTFTGRFKNESSSEALDALKMIESFKYSISGRNVTIYK